MKIKILCGLIGCLSIFSANAQMITAPVGQSLTITNAVDVTGGGVNILAGNEYKIGGKKVISNKGTANLFLGENAGNSITTGGYNLFFGLASGVKTTTGSYNSFSGFAAGSSNTIGSFNMFSGVNSGASNISGSFNVFHGYESGQNNTTGNYNFFLGFGSGKFNTTGYFNTFIGVNAGNSNTTGISNMFLGYESGQLTTIGSYNTFLGYRSGKQNSTGQLNLFLGLESGLTNTIGSNNTLVGNNTNTSSNNLNNATAIGFAAIASASNTVVLGNAATTITGTGLAAGSGLRFAKLTSASAAGTGGSGKVLSVDASGNVILVALTGAGVSTTSVGDPVAENWKESDGYLYNNSTNGVVIKGSGLEGNALIVKGGVLSKEVNVKVEGSEAWPDYVFKTNYKRMTLGEVEKFIAINGHLPNMPSATEMVANGNNLGKTDIKLLEKVEELTLYLLEMKKVNDAQAAALKSLKQQISKLRKK